MKKNAWRYHYFTPASENLDDMIYSFWDKECDRLGHFCLSTTPALKKTAGDVAILHMCTKNDNYLMHGSWGMERDGMFLSFWTIFCPFTPLTTPKLKILKKLKKKKRMEISSFSTSAPKIMIICYTVPKIRRGTDVIVVLFWAIFRPLTLPNNPKV